MELRNEGKGGSPSTFVGPLMGPQTPQEKFLRSSRHSS